MKKTILAAIALFTFALFASEGTPKVAPADQPQYNANGELQLPKNYRDWVFLSSGLGMDYSKTEREIAGIKPEDEPMFDTVFVSPSAYRAFQQTGSWPDKTVFVLEVRAGDTHVTINHGGYTQGMLHGISSSVKDESRFKEKWAYFGFPIRNGVQATSSKIISKDNCWSCHNPHGAVDNTFVQFYPTLKTIAQAKGTYHEKPEPKRE